MQQGNLEGEKLQTGRWTKEEHERFMYAIMQYGKDWKKVEQYVRTRSGSQVRSHAQKFFNKLQRTSHRPDHPPGRNAPEFSETQFDVERELNNEMTPSTPIELVSLIRRQPKEEGGFINIEGLKESLERRNEQEAGEMPESLSRQNSFKSMSNILSAYEQVNAEGSEKVAEEESFLILLTKKYKGLFRKIGDFDKLIDLSSNSKAPENPGRKRSFTLPEGSDLDPDQLDEKVEEIKKQINPDKKKTVDKKTPSGDRKLPEKVRSPEASKEEGSGAQQDKRPADDVPGALNRLATIQEQREQEEFNSYRAVPVVEQEGDGERGEGPRSEPK